jgi:mannosyl-oligosaccharide glucosidase
VSFPMTGSGSSRRPAAAARNRERSSSSEPEPDASRSAAAARRRSRGDHGLLRLLDLTPRALMFLGIASVALVSVAYVAYTGWWWEEAEGEVSATLRTVMRSVTPLPAPRMMDLPQVMQFQTEQNREVTH